MGARLHRIFLIAAAVGCAILWIGSNVRLLGDLIRAAHRKQ